MAQFPNHGNTPGLNHQCSSKDVDVLRVINSAAIEQTIEAIDKVAELFGVRLAETKDLHPAHHGMYIHHQRLILLRAGLDEWNYRSIFAHELAHAFYRDETHGDTRTEKRANQ